MSLVTQQLPTKKLLPVTLQKPVEMAAGFAAGIVANDAKEIYRIPGLYGTVLFSFPAQTGGAGSMVTIGYDDALLYAAAAGIAFGTPYKAFGLSMLGGLLATKVAYYLNNKLQIISHLAQTDAAAFPGLFAPVGSGPASVGRDDDAGGGITGLIYQTVPSGVTGMQNQSAGTGQQTGGFLNTLVGVVDFPSGVQPLSQAYPAFSQMEALNLVDDNRPAFGVNPAIGGGVPTQKGKNVAAPDGGWLDGYF